jgi:phosphoribosylamine--glycine ligase
VKEAEEAIDEIMRGRIFGDAGEKIVVEEFLEGEEVSFIGLTDGTTVLPLASSQDHKRALDGDRGPNTGGMGAYSPAPIVSPELNDRLLREVMQPVVTALREAKIDYRGVLYAGIMVTENGPKVLEFNVRFGDPETQVLMATLDGDLAEVLAAAASGRLDAAALGPSGQHALCIVLAAHGYPDAPRKGDVISGLSEAEQVPGVRVIHAGTALDERGNVVTAGGRVLGVTASADTLAEAHARAYEGARKIHFAGMQYRRDIAGRAGLAAAI